MTLPKPLRETLVHVAGALGEARAAWWIIAGAAAAIHGASPIGVADVDVLVGVADAERLFAALGIPPLAQDPHPRFRSAVFGRWTDPPLPVEIMADFRVCDADGVWRPVVPATRLPVTVDGATVFVPDRVDLIGMLRRFGRDKDHQRIAMLDRAAARPLD